MTDRIALLRALTGGLLAGTMPIVIGACGPSPKQRLAAESARDAGASAGWEELCAGRDRISLLEDLQPAREYGAWLRVQEAYIAGPDAITEARGDGDPCPSRPNPCVNLIRDLVERHELCDDQGCGPVLIATAGDEVAWATRDGGDLHALLGDIDTPGEAALVAWLAREPLACALQPTSFGLSVYPAEGGGYDIWYPLACDVGGARKLHVTAEGTVTVLRQERGGPQACFD